MSGTPTGSEVVRFDLWVANKIPDWNSDEVNQSEDE